jgi:tetratricopeptide (TPR) repeat protein
VPILLLILILSFSPPTWSEEDNVDYLSLAQILVKDGYYERAEKTLNKIKVSEIEDKSLFQSLKAMIELNKKNYKESIYLFHESIKNGMKEKEKYLYLSEAYLQLKDLKQALYFIEKVSQEDKQKIAYFIIKAEIAWQSDEKINAWQILDLAESKKLSYQVLTKKRFQYLLQEGLYQSAFDRAQKLIINEDSFLDVLAMASQLREKKQNDLSLNLLQTLHLIRPSNEVVALEMAQNYLALKQIYSAALVLEGAAKHNISLSYEAAEMFKQIGKNYRARFLNLTTEDPAKRLKQQLSLYLEEDDYFSMTFLIPQLVKHHVLAEQEIQYAVAYSLFRTGDFKRSEKYLDKIDKQELFEKSVDLKKEIQNCIEEKWACNETI